MGNFEPKGIVKAV